RRDTAGAAVAATVHLAFCSNFSSIVNNNRKTLPQTDHCLETTKSKWKIPTNQLKNIKIYSTTFKTSSLIIFLM
ncbi:hypothetical protein, partial [Serratia marcescens]|uniref:hypothetical protein n=1 Tax=Serratia marcescens TaxID=615 RepID=UPI0019553FCA